VKGPTFALQHFDEFSIEKHVPVPDRYCGLLLNCLDTSLNGNIIYSSVEPYGFHVFADAAETNYETSMAKGFCLNYDQVPC